MKIVYCDMCRDISIKSNLERETCNRCDRPAQRVPYNRSWHYYASAVVLLATAIFLWVLPPTDLMTRLVILAFALFITVVLTSWSLRTLRSRVLREIRKARAPQEKRA